MRWIPVGMTVNYLKIAKTDLRGVGTVDVAQMGQPGEVVAHVDVLDAHDVVVFTADITMRVSAKKRAAA